MSPSPTPQADSSECPPLWVRGRALTLGSLVWLALTLLDPALDVGNQEPVYLASLVLVATGAAAACAVLSTAYDWRPVPYLTAICLAVIAAMAVTATFAYGAHWLTLWLLLAIVGGAVTDRRLAPFMVVSVTVAAAAAAWQVHGTWADTWVQGLIIFLAGAGTAVFTRLNETIGELNRTREELAQRAVQDERQRFSRDLHDLLGHTLSVIVVKAEAVRRLTGRDPDGAAQHARDIEDIGRRALTEVREAVAGYRGISLATETARAREALTAAGITVEIARPPESLAEATDEALAWVVREGVTNVIRHSGAQHCRIAIHGTDSAAVLELRDDGPGNPTSGRGGGIDGLRQRVALVNGRLETRTLSPGFALTAHIPADGSPTDGPPEHEKRVDA